VQYFPFLGKWFQWGVGIGSWNYGEGYEPLILPLQSKNSTPQPPPLPEEGEFDTLRITPTICYESIYPSFVRNFVDNGANMLAVITNDGWYGRSSGPYQHEQFAVLRAIEDRRWIVRSANTGISTVIDDRGRFVKSLPLFTSGSITERVPLIERKTLYVRYGDFVAISAMWYSIVILIFGIIMRISGRSKKQQKLRLLKLENNQESH
jgi:apolipoprotein N-acyltransferase